jgi:hypothetical protein
MPGVVPPPATFFIETLKRLDQRIRALETQQQMVFVDNNLVAQALAGNLQYDNEGVATGLGNVWGYAVKVNGVWVAFDNVLNPQFGYAGAQVSTTSATPVSLTGGPTTPSVLVGPSGTVLVTMSAFIEPVGGNLSGYVVPAMDGALFIGGQLMLFSNVGASTLAAGSASMTQLLTSISPGLHTFSLMYYSSTSGDQIIYANRMITAQPF